MSTGYRCFVVQGDEVTHISQKSFNAFFDNAQPQLPQYARRTIVLATVFYDVEHRVPQRVVHISATRVRVDSDGSLDETAFLEHIQNKFNSRRGSRVVLLPEPRLSRAAMSKMLDAIFR